MLAYYINEVVSFNYFNSYFPYPKNMIEVLHTL